MSKLFIPLNYEDQKAVNQKLIHALFMDDIQGILAAINEGANVNAIDEDECTPLHIAAGNPTPEATRILIENGAIVDSCTTSKKFNGEINKEYTALHIAVKMGNLDIVQTLLNAGAEINYRGEIGRAPIQIASELGHLSIVEELIARGANVEVYNHGTTPLCLAAEKGYYQIVKALLDAGAKIDSHQLDGRTPISLAILNHHPRIVELLVNNSDYTNPPDRRDAPIHLAAAVGDLEIVKILVDKGANVNALDYPGHTPLYIAARNGHPHVVQFLIELGAKVNVFHFDCTPLLHAVNNEHFEVVEVLLKAKAHVNEADGSGTTPLIKAAVKGNFQIAQLLLKYGAAIDAASYNANHPLISAIYGGNLQVVQLLLSSGANTDIVDNRDRSPLFAAISEGHKEIAQHLIECGLNINYINKHDLTPLLLAILGDHLEIGNMLIKGGADLNLLAGNTTPLLAAAKANRFNFIKLLLANGADIEMLDNHRITALDKAILHNNKESVMLLLEHGAKINLITGSDNLAIDNLLKISKIADKLANQEIISSEDYTFISSNIPLFSTLGIRAESLLVKKFCETYVLPDVSGYPFWNEEAKTKLTNKFYNKIIENLAVKIAKNENLTDNAIGLIASIQTDEKLKAVKKAFLEHIKQKCSEQYLKDGYKFNHEKYSLFFSEADIKNIENAVLYEKNECLNKAISILAAIFDFMQMADLNLDCEEKHKNVQEVLEDNKAYILENVPSSKKKIVSKIYNKALESLENPREFLLDILNNESNLAKELKVNIEGFLSLKPGKISYNEHKAAVYRIIKDIAKQMPENAFVNKLLSHDKELYFYDHFSSDEFAARASIYGENLPFKLNIFFDATDVDGIIHYSVIGDSAIAAPAHD